MGPGYFTFSANPMNFHPYVSIVSVFILSDIILFVIIFLISGILMIVVEKDKKSVGPLWISAWLAVESNHQVLTQKYQPSSWKSCKTEIKLSSKIIQLNRLGCWHTRVSSTVLVVTYRKQTNYQTHTHI